LFVGLADLDERQCPRKAVKRSKNTYGTLLHSGHHDWHPIVDFVLFSGARTGADCNPTACFVAEGLTRCERWTAGVVFDGTAAAD